MERSTSPKKKLKSPGVDPTANINIRTSVTCANVPDSLFDAASAKKHFSKFGRVQKIRLFPRRQMCIIEYDQPLAAERAVLNAGAFDGFMFDVTRTKARVRRKSKREEDPDWVPDSDVEEELSAMSGAPTYRITRQKPMDQGPSNMAALNVVKRPAKQLPIRVKPPIREKKLIVTQTTTNTDTAVVPTTQTSMSTPEAAAELNQLRFRVSTSPDEQWRTLDARDRVLRAWGGAGSRLRAGGATLGTCPDKCPEKELLHRQAEHQTMTLETAPESDGAMEAWRAVKQYSRSSADQEIPMCYELRPAPVLMRTCAYLLHEIADTKRQVTLADWFHFMWDRLRGIRKDITQQALCCADSIRLVEMCARFHAHCAARLADLEHTQFDQKLNTDNLTKCLQTLKHMYADVGPELKPCEPEFRGYIALLNLGDANFWWEIKQLPREIQKSPQITFAMKVFNALDNNNYVRFFRLVREHATYLQACVLLRYFNDVRARALARIVRAYAARGGSKYPAEDLMNALSFETVESMRSFITHYGLRFGRDETDLSIILDRHQFIEDSDPFPIARAIRLIESKRHSTVGEVVAGGRLPHYDGNFSVYTSFNKDGRLKESALVAEDQGYNTLNDSNKDVGALKVEIQRQGGRPFVATQKTTEPNATLFVKPNVRSLSPAKPPNVFAAKSNVFAAPSSVFSAPPNVFAKPSNDTTITRPFLFKPAIPVASTDIIKKSPDRIFGTDNKSKFSFSKPQDTSDSNSLFAKDSGNLTKQSTSVFSTKTSQDSLFSVRSNENKDPFPNSQSLFKKQDSSTIFTKPEESGIFKKPVETNVFKKPDVVKSVFSRLGTETNNGDINKNVFSKATTQNVFETKSIFGKPRNETNGDSAKPTNIFAKAAAANATDSASNIFGSVSKPNTFKTTNNLFAPPEPSDNQKKSVFASNGDVSPGTLFKSANHNEGKTYSIFQSKNKIPTVADSIFNSVNSQNDVYDFKENNNQEQEKLQFEIERKIQEEIDREIQERKKEEERIRELKRQEEERSKEEERRKLVEMQRLEEKRRKEEERKQEELRKKLEEERKAELKRKAEEEERKFKERVEAESIELTEELVNEVSNETVIVILTEETENMKSLTSYAETVSEEICNELCDEISFSEIKAERFFSQKLKKKWFHIWKRQFHRNFQRRYMLEDTPIWLPERSPVQEAARLRRIVENATLCNMNAIHKGYKFKGELRQLPSPERYNVMEIIRSSLLKRMKQINYPYDKCFFWKVTLVSPGPMKWVGKKIEIEKWIFDAFGDKQKHASSESLICVEKQSWNHLMDFAISVSLTNSDRKSTCGEALDGTNGLLFYTSEKDHNFLKTIEETIKQLYPFQILPVTVILPKIEDESIYSGIEQVLTNFMDKQIIYNFKIFVLDNLNISESLNMATKAALKWMAKKFPHVPPLEVDRLKYICERYLGNEIWCRLKSDTDSRMTTVLKDLHRLTNCYNVAVDKLTDVITNEDLFNYAPFPLEFNKYLDHTSPYPKPYEFIPTNARNSDNTSAIRATMAKLKLPSPVSKFQPIDVGSMQNQVRKYCNQIGWFENPEEIVCKIVAKLPTQFNEVNMPCELFSQYLENYDLTDFLNILVYEKINRLQNFDNRYAIYKKSVLEDYRNGDWLYESEPLSRMKHKPIEYEDELDMYIEAKRRRIAMDSMEDLALEDADCTMVEENIKVANESISKYNNCKEAVKQLEDQIEIERKKAMQLENLLKSALANV